MQKRDQQVQTGDYREKGVRKQKVLGGNQRCSYTLEEQNKIQGTTFLAITLLKVPVMSYFFI